MAAKKTQQREKCGVLVTPKGKALWATAPNPSPYDERKCEASIILSAEDTTVFKEQVTELCKEAADKLGVDIKEAVDNLFKVNTDKDGNPTGDFRLKAKTGIQYPPTFADAKGKTFKPSVDFSIPNGTVIRLSVGLEVHVVKPTFKGIVVRLRGIQIVSMPESPVQFDEAEGDYTYEPEAATGADWGSTSGDAGWE